jgi:hypothetical protein
VGGRRRPGEGAKAAADDGIKTRASDKISTAKNGGSSNIVALSLDTLAAAPSLRHENRAW